MLEEIERIGDFPIFGDKLNAMLLDEGVLFHFLQNAEPFQGEIAERHQGLAHVIAGKFGLLEQDDAMAFFREKSGCGSSTGTTPDHNDVAGLIIFGNIHGR